MANGVIQYQYPLIAEGVSKMRNANNYIQNQISDLDRQVKTLIGDFMGQSSTSYNTRANDIKTKLNQSNDKLNLLTNQVNNGANNMQSADGREANRFAN